MENCGKIIVGDATFEVVDDGVPAIFVDLISEFSLINGIIRLGLVSVVADGDGSARAQVAARIRMNLATAGDLRNMLASAIDGNNEAKEKAN